MPECIVQRLMLTKVLEGQENLYFMCHVVMT